MEYRDSIPFMYALTPGERQSAPEELLPVWMCYQVGNGPALYRCCDPNSIYGGILSAHDGAFSQCSRPERFCTQVVRECQARNAQGFLANWSQMPTGFTQRLTERLEGALTEAGLAFYVTEPYAACCQCAFVLVSSASFRIPLREKLSRLGERYGSERLILAFVGTRMAFSLPSPSGQGRRLSDEQLLTLRQRFSPTIHFSHDFMMQYFTYEQQKRTHLAFFDDETAFREKQLLAEELGLGGFLSVWQEAKRYL